MSDHQFFPIVITAIEWTPDLATGEPQFRLRAGDVTVTMDRTTFEEQARAAIGWPSVAAVPRPPAAPPIGELQQSVPTALDLQRTLMDSASHRLLLLIDWGAVGSPHHRLALAPKDGKLEAKLKWG